MASESGSPSGRRRLLTRCGPSRRRNWWPRRGAAAVERGGGGAGGGRSPKAGGCSPTRRTPWCRRAIARLRDLARRPSVRDMRQTADRGGDGDGHHQRIRALAGALRRDVVSPVLRILGAVDEQMFNDGDLRLALEAQTQKMVAAVDAESEEVLAQADIDEWSAALAHHFAVACPDLTTDAVWMEPPTDVDVDVSRDWGRAIVDRTQTRCGTTRVTDWSSTCHSRATARSSSSRRARTP